MKRPAVPLLVIATANAFVGMELGRAGSGESVLASMLREVRLFPDPLVRHLPPWDAAFVHHVGFWSHYDESLRESTWPLPAAATADQLAVFARERSMLVKSPRAGDVFLLWNSARGTFSRTGIVVTVEQPGKTMLGRDYEECVVIEGDTDAHRTLHGGQVLRHSRRLCPSRGDRFIRWTDAKSKHGTPRMAA